MPSFIAILRGIIGITTLLALAVLWSTSRRAINWRVVIAGIGIQFLLALMILRTTTGQVIFQGIGTFFARLLDFTYEGTEFLFGSLGRPEGETGMIFAFHVLPVIIFFGALMSALYYLRLIQPLIRGMGYLMRKTLRISGAESLAAAANVFVGHLEGVLVIRPYIKNLTRSELMTLMTGGMATIAGSVMSAYIAMLGGDSPASQSQFAAHLLSASLMSAPAAIVTSKILVPETGSPSTLGPIDMNVVPEGANLLEVAADGAAEGLKLAMNVGAMLLAFIALIGLMNFGLRWMGNPTVFGVELYDLNTWIAASSNGRFESLTLQAIFGYLFAPMAWLMGIQSADVLHVGTLLGEKIAVNEFIAYSSLRDIQTSLSERSVIISTYALCGFANFASIAMQIGAIGGIAPSRRSDVAELGLRAVAGGALASWMTATIAGMLVAPA
jgi:CNT family concentrative nucleoside transporter